MQTKTHKSTSSSQSQDRSVVFALSELFALEEERIAQEAEEVARLEAEAEAQAEAKAAQAKREQEERERAERAEMARIRMEAELAQQAKSEERDANLDSMRDQLQKVRAEREALRLRVADLAGQRVPSRPSRWPWIVTGLGALAAAFALWVSWPAPAPAPVVSAPIAISAPAAVEDPVEAPAAAGIEVAQADPEAPAAAAPAEEAPAHARGGRHGRGIRGGRGGRQGHETSGARGRDHGDRLGLGDIGGGGDGDVLTGIDLGGAR